MVRRISPGHQRVRFSESTLSAPAIARQCTPMSGTCEKITRAKPALASSARMPKLIHAPWVIPHTRADRYGSHRKSARPRAKAVARRSDQGQAGERDVTKRAVHTANSAINATIKASPVAPKIALR